MKKRVKIASFVVIILVFILAAIGSFALNSTFAYDGHLTFDAEDTNLWNLQLNTEEVYHNSELLGAQFNNQNRSSVRFVSVVHSDILKAADDYGYMFYYVDKQGIEKDAKTVTAILQDTSVNNSYVKYSCKGKVNELFKGNYGNNIFDAGSPAYTRYKYITASVNGVKDDKYLIARFYVLVNDEYHYAVYNSRFRACAYSSTDLAAEMGKKIELVGHRGAMDIAPENTLASFDKAAQRGYPYVETDFWVTNSGDILCLHNENLMKCGYPNYSVRDLTDKTRFNFPIVNDKNALTYGKQFIPTVEEVIKKVSSLKMKLYLHVKDKNVTDEKLDEIIAILIKYNMFDKTVFVSSSPECCEKLIRHKCSTSYLVVFPSDAAMENAFNFCEQHNIPNLMVKYKGGYPHPEDAERAHSSNIKIGVYNANNITKALWLIDKNFDYVMINNWM